MKKLNNIHSLKTLNNLKENMKFMNYIDQINAHETQIYFASQNTKTWSPMKQNMTSPGNNKL